VIEGLRFHSQDTPLCIRHATTPPLYATPHTLSLLADADILRQRYAAGDIATLQRTVFALPPIAPPHYAYAFCATPNVISTRVVVG